ncbi:cytidylyltransferase domain-containing protein [Haloglomus halophilum]|uniref:acylneuraminate cytidylyltransferase family protein n=1 Tax=Haloglomus halophilum TaxID=2962672 RepID=UPI0020CA0FB2|nr:acylneuraminate cytidylyltransferase family protein [Haloglomus halophilum]
MPRLAALVPMKGHSERVPNKNLRDFNGRPLCHWILNTLRVTPEVDEIVVNTDSPEIGSEAKEFDATVIDRPEQLQGDYVPMNDIILYDVERVDADLYLQTHCTNPLLRSGTIRDAVAMLEENESCDSVFSVTSLQTRLWDDNCRPINHERDQLQRTQDLDPVYEENSNIYLFTQDSVESRENRIGDRPMMFPMEEEEAIDIDEPIDFRIAEFLHKDRYGEDPELQTAVDS